MLSKATLADLHRIMQVLKKYSDSQIVQKILKESFEGKNSDTKLGWDVSDSISHQKQQDEIV